jgi:hypothetical protein
VAFVFRVARHTNKQGYNILVESLTLSASPNNLIIMAELAMGHGSNWSAKLDGSHGS